MKKVIRRLLCSSAETLKPFDRRFITLKNDVGVQSQREMDEVWLAHSFVEVCGDMTGDRSRRDTRLARLKIHVKIGTCSENMRMYWILCVTPAKEKMVWFGGALSTNSGTQNTEHGSNLSPNLIIIAYIQKAPHKNEAKVHIIRSVIAKTCPHKQYKKFSGEWEI